MTRTIGEDQVVVGVLTPESLLGALLLALPCLKLVGNGRRNKNPANARFGPGLFQNEHARVALRALRVEEEDVFLLKRLHGQLQMGIIANIKCEKNVSASQTSRLNPSLFR